MREKSSQFEGKIRSARKRVEAKPICLSCNKPFASRETVERLLGRGRMSPSTAKRSWKFTSPRATMPRHWGEDVVSKEGLPPCRALPSSPCPRLLAAPSRVSRPRRAFPCSPRSLLPVAPSHPRHALPSSQYSPLLAVLFPLRRALPPRCAHPPPAAAMDSGGPLSVLILGGP